MDVNGYLKDASGSAIGNATAAPLYVSVVGGSRILPLGATGNILWFNGSGVWATVAPPTTNYNYVTYSTTSSTVQWSTISHYQISDLQGGTTSQYYHLTSAQQASVAAWNVATASHNHNIWQLTGYSTQNADTVDNFHATSFIFATTASATGCLLQYVSGTWASLQPGTTAYQVLLTQATGATCYWGDLDCGTSGSRKCAFQLRRDPALNWYTANPTLMVGGVALETDTHIIKTGDGTTAYNSLGFPIVPYYNYVDGDPKKMTLSQLTEKFPFIDDFLNNTLGQYATTGTITWSSGKITYPTNAYTPKILKTLYGSDRYGVYRSVFKFVSAPGAGQRFNPLYVSSTLRIYVTYYVNFRIGLYDEGGTSVIAETDTGVPVDTNSHKIKLNYASTGYTIYFDDVQIGSETASTLAPTSIGAGCNSALSGGSTVEVSWLSFIPSVTFSNSYSSDTEARYHQLASTDLTTWAAAAAGDVAVSGGALVLASDDDRGICAAVRSYNFKSGEIECSFDNNNDGGGGADTCCLLFGYQDINNYYRLALEDDGAGAENLKLYKVVAGSATQIGSTKDVSATYTRSNKTWVKVQWDSEKGRIWAWLRDNAGTYPTTPDISDAFSAAFSMGKVGYLATVATAGAGNLNVAFDDLTVRCNCLIGETNVPATETGFYLRDEYSINDIGRYTALTPAVWSVTGGVLRYTKTSAYRDNIRLDTPKLSTLDVSVDITIAAGASASNSAGITFCWDGVNNAGADSRCPRNCYDFVINGHGTTRYYIRKWVNGSPTVLGYFDYTFNTGTPYTLRVVYDPTTDKATFYIDGAVVQSNFSLGAGFTSGYVGYYTYTDTGIINDFDNLVVSGTRYYFKPMLRGAQIGEWWDGSKSVYGTRFTDDHCWDTTAEYTVPRGTLTADTANGHFALARDGSWYGDYYPAGLLFSTVTLLSAEICLNNAEFLQVRIPVGGYNYYVEIDATKVRLISASAGQLASVTTTVSTTAWYSLMIDAGTSGFIKVYWNGLLIINTFGLCTTALTYPKITVYGTTASDSVYIRALKITGIESLSLNGSNLTLGGVPHGARYDTQEYAALSFTNRVKYGTYKLVDAAKCTATATTNTELYFANSTDSATISTASMFTLTFSATGTTTDFVNDIMLLAKDRNDTITLQARRQTATTDNSAAVFIEYNALVPLTEVATV